MRDRTPSPAELDPIERASLDELRALQLERLRWSLWHAYENVIEPDGVERSMGKMRRIVGQRPR